MEIYIYRNGTGLTKLQDLGSLLAFLQICQPLDNEDFFKRLLLRPLRYGRTEGAELLRVRLLPSFYCGDER